MRRDASRVSFLMCPFCVRGLLTTATTAPAPRMQLFSGVSGTQICPSSCSGVFVDQSGRAGRVGGAGCGGFEPTRRRRGSLIGGVRPRARCGLSVLRPGEALAQGDVRSGSSLIERAAAKGAIKADERTAATCRAGPGTRSGGHCRLASPTETVKGLERSLSVGVFRVRVWRR
jgi:hypothetical protein